MRKLLIVGVVVIATALLLTHTGPRATAATGTNTKSFTISSTH